MSKKDVKKYISDRYGFMVSRIVLLEADMNEPWKYVMFEVKGTGTQYQARCGEISIYKDLY